LGLLIGEYGISLMMLGKAELPPYKGSTFRGVFVKSLKQVVCALKHQECADCLLREKCIYYRVFEGANTGEARTKGSLTHPFVIEPPDCKKVNYNKGDLIQCKLILFGWANEYLPYFVYAFNEMGRCGIGKRIQGKRGTFELDKVETPSGIVYSKYSKSIKKHTAREFRYEDFEDAAPECSSLVVELHTPLRLKVGNQYSNKLDFQTLIRACLRRISTLHSCFGDCEPKLDYRRMVAKARSIVTLDSSAKWFDWTRYSSRQNESMLMGGLLGKMRYKGELSVYLPLLNYCEKVHLGKGTTFGLGKIGLRTDNNEENPL
jgi:hypothetical protein